jgi:ferredoxin-type protein NapF
MCRKICRESLDTEDGRKSPFHTDDSPWTITARIGGQCLTGRGILCRSCGEECERRAITFRLQAGGFAQPRIDEQSCSGCGGCLYVCPTQAVRIF